MRQQKREEQHQRDGPRDHKIVVAAPGQEREYRDRGGQEIKPNVVTEWLIRLQVGEQEPANDGLEGVKHVDSVERQEMASGAYDDHRACGEDMPAVRLGIAAMDSGREVFVSTALCIQRKLRDAYTSSPSAAVV